MIKRTCYFAALSVLAINTAWAATISITSPVTNAVVSDSITMKGACNTGSKVKADVRDSDNLLSTTITATCASSKYSVAVSSVGLKAGTLRLRAIQAVNGVSEGAYTYVTKNAPAAPALVLVIENPAANAAITAANQAAVVVNGGCNLGSAVQINATDSANNVLATQWTGCNAENDFHGQLDLTSLKDGNITIKTYVELNGATKTATVNVVKNTAPALAALQILAPAANFAVNASNQDAIAISGKCADKLVMKLQATDSANKLSDITWIMCENSNFWGPINMTSLADGNISVRAFQEVNGVMQNQYVTVVKKTAVVTPALAVTLGSLASVKEGTASTLTVNKVAGTAAGTVAYQVLNNASKAVIASGSLVFAAADTAKTISVLYPKDNVVNASVKLEIKVGSLASLIVPVTDIDVATPPATALAILAPAANFAVTADNMASIEVSGKCTDAMVMKLQATDSANKLSEITWIMCENSNFWGPIDMSGLADGNISIRAFQDVNGVTNNQYVVVKKSTSVVTPPASNKIIIGVNAHDGYGSGSPYGTSQAETIKRMKVLGDRGIKSYRAAEVLAYNGGTTVAQYGARWGEMDFLISEAKKNGITIRPGMLLDNEEIAYQIAKRFANDIRVWELGNEVDLLDPSQWAGYYKTMVTTYKGIKRAAADTGIDIGTTLNFVACGYTRCNVPEGDMAFVDGAYAAGFKFDYLSFHYYPAYSDFIDSNGYWQKKYLTQMRLVAQKYNKKVFFNEMNCGEIYPPAGQDLATIDGGFAGDHGCYDSVKLMLTELNTNYKDLVLEINMYELLDAPNFLLENPDYPARERHFGMMYDIDHPKPEFDMVSTFAK